MYDRVMVNDQNKGGRPKFYTDEEKRKLLIKLEPYLKSGLSVRKALQEAQIQNGTFYRIMEEDEGFREQIETFKNFTSVLLNSAMVTHLHSITMKQSNNENLNREDIRFLQWFALNSNLCKEEFGNRDAVTLYDPEVEIQKMKKYLEENTTKEDPPLEISNIEL